MARSVPIMEIAIHFNTASTNLPHTFVLLITVVMMETVQEAHATMKQVQDCVLFLSQAAQLIATVLRVSCAR